MNTEQFRAHIKACAKTFKKWPDQQIKAISHLDCDGICSAAITTKFLIQEDKQFNVSVVHQLNDENLQQMAKEPYEQFIFTDLGAGKLASIIKYFKEKKVLILDHHEIEEVAHLPENILFVNPHSFKIDGGKTISGSGVVYLFAEAVNEKNKEIAHLAIIGAIGDAQENNGFTGLNKYILEQAKETGNLTVTRGLRLFGIQTRPLHKVLEYSTDPYIPGVSGSESKAINFLLQLGIDPKKGKEWKKIPHLTEEEMNKLISGIVMKRAEEQKPEDVMGNIYTLTKEQEGNVMRDAKEYSTLLNACGRMNKASYGIAACIGDKNMKKKAMETLQEYRGEIIKAMQWFNNNKESKQIIEGKNYLLINAEEEIKHTIIGTLASILSKSNEYKEGTLILSLARSSEEPITKASLRIAGKRTDKLKHIDLCDTAQKIVSISGGEAGGHQFAAGAIIPLECEKKFIEAAQQVLNSIGLEEGIEVSQ